MRSKKTCMWLMAFTFIAVFTCFPILSSATVLEQNLYSPVPPATSYNAGPGWTTDLVNLSSSQTLTIQSIQVQVEINSTSDTPINIKVYSRPGTSVGYEGSSAGWTLAGQYNAGYTAQYSFIDVPLSLPIEISRNGTAGIYAVVNDGNNSFRLLVSVPGMNTETDDGTLQINNAPGHFVSGLFGGVPPENQGWPGYVRPQLWVTYEATAATPVLPTVTTEAVTDISTTTATGNGTITDLGVPEPTAHGICWNTGGTPTTVDGHTDEGTASATGAFVSSMTGLSPNTTYHVRAYATNTAGTAYGADVTFSTAAAPPVQAVPTLSEWGVLIMSLLLAGMAIRMIRRHQTTK